ncbi:Coenzyme F420 hydrogenase/dehydrogenase, beta subunit C-terminal domain [Butyrivibrio sp. MC2021]|uniref:Coenzyme F420 hydrogenase/dehydrogenase, beta subunit C-terminal domain n=1 Tax=Butyrivibrio sp. MC2021 TaxID=1408306 RepID=UPI00055B6B82|nr:Coenzyme F420 hydrogenase/dehydrogenase, beta subunit C-terminal domain [Butyrivibrio sp. MC2021]
MNLVCDKNMCNACGACVAACPTNAISIKEDTFSCNAVIDTNKCIRCGLCKNKCPQLTDVQFYKSINWYQGWSKDDSIRKKSASGGAARALAESFIHDGGCVCSCVFEKGKFIYVLTDNALDIEKMSGSKYVKSNPQDCYEPILDKLKHDIPVLFIGLPCQAEGIRRYVPEKYHEKLYTVDLICHGTPSRLFLEKFLNEHEVELNKLNDIKFRYSHEKRDDSYKFIDYKGIMDRYSIAFLYSLTYTENCYKCKFARGERASDITLGDSWGSELSGEMTRGISLMLCQTSKGESLIKKSELILKDVDLKRAIDCNPQLQRTTSVPSARMRFVDDVNLGKGVNRSIFRYLKIACLKQYVKKVFIRMHLIEPVGYMISYK